MNKLLKFSAPVIVLAAAWVIWPESGTEDQVVKNEADLISIDESAMFPMSEQGHLDHQSIESPSQAPESPDLEVWSQEVTVFATTEEYEASSRYGSLPSHMSDLAMERFSIDNHGQLVVNESIKNIFEFFLMASHIEGEEQVIARIKEYIELNLSGDAARTALEIAENYLQYKGNLSADRFAMSTDFSQQENLNMLKAALEDKKHTRREYLGEAVSEALFGHEERYDDFSYNRLAINSDNSLSQDDKDQRIAAAEQQLPSEMAADMRHKREEKKLNETITHLKGSAGNEEEIYQLRADFYGDKVAKRMAYLESNSPEWQARVDAFYQTQVDILNSDSMSDHEKSLAIKQVKQESFTHKEQIKLAVQSIRGV